MKLTPSRARIVLSLIFIVVVMAIFGGSYYVYTFLSGIASEVSVMRGDVASADAKVRNTELLKKQMEDNKEIMEKARWLVGETKMYKYQNQIINDISVIASKSGVSVKSFVFDNSTISGSKKSSQKSSSSKSSPQMKSTLVSIELNGSNEYTKILHFMSLLEQNTTRMQMLGVSLSQEKDENGDLKIQTIDMEVYVR